VCLVQEEKGIFGGRSIKRCTHHGTYKWQWNMQFGLIIEGYNDDSENKVVRAIFQPNNDEISRQLNINIFCYTVIFV
jgi:hypothetical protein